MKEIQNYSEEKEQNVFAKKVDDAVIHISDAESGRNGYFCLGCGGIMQAKKGKIMVHHFSHEPKDVTRIGKCTYSDETYRHKLAKEVLQRIKQIKVPAVYKFPPKDFAGVANKIKDSETIYASKVGIELYFYESEDGTIKYTNSSNWTEDDKKFLIIKPDVTFFNSENKPILFIEIVATHKVNDEKLSKIRKLGINTVQVTIPKDSAAEIENTFSKTERTKWIYNHEEAKSEYIRISIGDAEGVSLIDELQRELFEESFRCRASQIRNFIRAIGKCLGSESYTKTEQKLRDEIQRTERNTIENRERLRGIHENLQRKIDSEFEPESERIRGNQDRVESEYNLRRDEIEGKYTDLEGRYKRKKQDIISEESRIGELQEGFEPTDKPEVERIESHLQKLGIGRKSLDERIREIKSEEIEFERAFGNQERILETTKSDIERKLGEIEKRRSELPTEFRDKEEIIRTEFSTRAEGIRSEFEIDCRTTIREIENRNINGISKFSLRIKEILDKRELLPTFTEAINDAKRKRTAKQFFDKKSWKDWDWS
jgi:hypothetical protein